MHLSNENLRIIHSALIYYSMNLSGEQLKKVKQLIEQLNIKERLYVDTIQKLIYDYES